MPIPIVHLFSDEQEIHKIPDEGDMAKMSKSWSDIPVSLNDVPVLQPPFPGSNEFIEDLDQVKKYFFSPVNSKKFLQISNDKPFDILKNYCKSNNLNFDVESLKKINEQFSRLVLNLKFKYNRQRPKKYMQISNDTFPYERIGDNNSPSYPSGHAAHAYFNAKILSKKFPEHSGQLFNLANLVCQSRIDLGRHYPSDVEFGKFVGQLCADKFLHDKSHKSKRESINERANITINNLATGRKLIINAARKHNLTSNLLSYTDELCEFIVLSNKIERYAVDIQEAFEAAQSFLKGLPVEYCTNNKYIKSHLTALEAAAFLHPIDSITKIQKIHEALGCKVLERGEPGVFRPFNHFARNSGFEFSKPQHILNDLTKMLKNDALESPFEKHILYECIHPFSDGNGRSGRIILASDLLFDFEKLNNFIGKDYISNIIEYQSRF